MLNDKNDHGPLWQIEQQVKHYENLALSFGRDAIMYTQRAEEARKMAERYRLAHEQLKECGVNATAPKT